MVCLLFRSLSRFLICLFIRSVRSLTHWLSSTRLACHQATFEPQAPWPGSSNFCRLPVLFACTIPCATNLLARCLPSVIPFSFILLSCLTLAVGVLPSSVGSLRQPLSRSSRLVPQRRGIVLCSSHAFAVVPKRMFVTTIPAHVRDVVVHYLNGMCRRRHSQSAAAASDQLSRLSPPCPPPLLIPRQCRCCLMSLSLGASFSPRYCTHNLTPTSLSNYRLPFGVRDRDVVTAGRSAHGSRGRGTVAGHFLGIVPPATQSQESVPLNVFGK